MWKFEPELSLDKLLQLSVGETTRLTGDPEPDWGSSTIEGLMSLLSTFTDITGIGVIELLLLRVVGYGRARRNHLMEVFRSYWCDDGCLVGSYYILKEYDRRNLEVDSRRAFESLFRHGLIVEGTEDLTPWQAEEGVVDFWESASYEVHDDSIELSDRGREICEHVESSLFELSQGAVRLFGDVICLVGSQPPVFSPCTQIHFDCPLRYADCAVEGPSCSARLLLRWRPAWWRKPRVGYLVLCQNEEDLAMYREGG